MNICLPKNDLSLSIVSRVTCQFTHWKYQMSTLYTLKSIRGGRMILNCYGSWVFRWYHPFSKDQINRNSLEASQTKFEMSTQSTTWWSSQSRLLKCNFCTSCSSFYKLRLHRNSCVIAIVLSQNVEESKRRTIEYSEIVDDELIQPFQAFSYNSTGSLGWNSCNS